VAIGDTLRLSAVSFTSEQKRPRVPADTGSVRWYSSDTTIATVDPKGVVNPTDTTVSTLVTAVRPSPTIDIFAVFDKLDTVKTTLIVRQDLARYTFSYVRPPASQARPSRR